MWWLGRTMPALLSRICGQELAASPIQLALAEGTPILPTG
jgi:hypothetical protein